jgi:fatty acid synthase
MAPQQKTEIQDNLDSIQAGMRLAHPPPGEEIVISGVAGCFPESENVYHFRDNLMNKVDMVTDNDRRWKLGLYTCFLCCFVTLCKQLYYLMLVMLVTDE